MKIENIKKVAKTGAKLAIAVGVGWVGGFIAGPAIAAAHGVVKACAYFSTVMTGTVVAEKVGERTEQYIDTVEDDFEKAKKKAFEKYSKEHGM